MSTDSSYHKAQSSVSQCPKPPILVDNRDLRLGTQSVFLDKSKSDNNEFNLDVSGKE